MPPKTALIRVKTALKTIGKKRTASGAMKTYTRRAQSGIPRSVSSPITYKFKQTFADTIELNVNVTPAGWTANANGLVQQQVFNLSDLPNFTRFTNLFAQYRLTSVKTEMFFLNTVSDVIDPASSNGNRQIIVYTMPNRIGSVETLTEDAFLQTQCFKKQLAIKTDGKPTVCYTDLSQLSSTYASGVNTDYAKTTPKFISTQENNTPHYGLDIRIQRVDGMPFSAGTASAYPFVKILHTVYFECRQVN